MTSTTAAFAQLLRTIDPGLRLIHASELAGGVSATVTAVLAAGPAGPAQKLVVRQYGAANLRADPHIAEHEFRLLSLLHAAGLPVPRPRYADESGTVLPGPYLVAEFIDGRAGTEPHEIPQAAAAFTGQLAAALAQLHAAAFTLADAPYLAALGGIAARRVAARPARQDQSLSEPAVRAALERIWPPPQLNKPVVLHGDYWPGNTLWRQGRLVGVIDWEDAVVGDPLADVGCARMEICLAAGLAAAREFTRQYRALMPALDFTALPHWDLYAALRHAGRMHEWGLPPAELARLQAGHATFTEMTLAQSPDPGATRRVTFDWHGKVSGLFIRAVEEEDQPCPRTTNPASRTTDQTWTAPI